jgi:hypothetical protein
VLNLALTTDKLDLITSAASTCVVHVSYVDDVIESAGPPRVDIFNAGKQNTAISTATTTDICAAPASTVIRNVKFISIRNTDASVSNVVTPRVNANGTIYELFSCTLLFDEELVCREGVWFHYDSNGGVYGQALPVASDTVVGGIEIATQAEMEAASSNTLAVAPGRMKYHPGVAKFILHTTGTATPVADANCTYGCTITDTGVGQLTINFSTAFSAAGSYCVQVCTEVISVTLTAAANVMQGYMRFGGQASASSCQVNNCDRTATTNVIRDPISWHVCGWGDHA